MCAWRKEAPTDLEHRWLLLLLCLLLDKERTLFSLPPPSPHKPSRHRRARSKTSMASTAKDNDQAFAHSPCASRVQRKGLLPVVRRPNAEIQAMQDQEVRASVLSDRSYGAANRQQASASPSSHCPSDFICKMFLKHVYYRKLPEQRK